MTKTFSINSSNDIHLDSAKNLAIVTGLQGVLQACQTATQAQLGEMLLQTGLGIPNFQTVWIGSPNYSTFLSFLRTTLTNIDGVQAVISLDLKPINNVLSYTAVIQTQFGAGTING